VRLEAGGIRKGAANPKRALVMPVAFGRKKDVKVGDRAVVLGPNHAELGDVGDAAEVARRRVRGK
jgi:hypothetical protein